MCIWAIWVCSGIAAFSSGSILSSFPFGKSRFCFYFIPMALPSSCLITVVQITVPSNTSALHLRSDLEIYPVLVGLLLYCWALFLLCIWSNNSNPAFDVFSYHNYCMVPWVVGFLPLASMFLDLSLLNLGLFYSHSIYLYYSNFTAAGVTLPLFELYSVHMGCIVLLYSLNNKSSSLFSSYMSSCYC